jgi:cell division protein ZapA
MRQVNITLGGKSHKLQCRPGDEDRVRELALVLEDRVTALAAQTRSPINERLLVMTALLLLDELYDLKATSGVTASDPPPATKSSRRSA